MTEKCDNGGEEGHSFLKNSVTSFVENLVDKQIVL